jgi:hypothetical protein
MQKNRTPGNDLVTAALTRQVRATHTPPATGLNRPGEGESGSNQGLLTSRISRISCAAAAGEMARRFPYGNRALIAQSGAPSYNGST